MAGSYAMRLSLIEEINIATIRSMLFKNDATSKKAHKIIYMINGLTAMDAINNPYRTTIILINDYDEIMEALKKEGIEI